VVNAEIDQALYDRIVAFVVRERGCGKDEIKPESRMYHDLGCTGLDGEDLLTALRDQFDVDIANFVHKRHFGPEATPGLSDLISWLLYMLLQRDKLKEIGDKKVPLTVMDLYEAAKSKKFADLSARAPE
jgi:acyl carrier protein